MTREEIEKFSVIGPYSFETDREERWYEIGCIDGLKVADEEPDTAELWHDASVMPKEKEWILVQFRDDGYDTFVQRITCQDIWCAWSKDNNISRWAYISDLLPKGGEV